MTNPNDPHADRGGTLPGKPAPRLVECDCCHARMVRVTARPCRVCGYGPMCADCIADDPHFRGDDE
jgi:hypothetical protein